jgi:hypothetical protein
MWLYDDPDSFTAVGRPGAHERRDRPGRPGVDGVLRRLHDDGDDLLAAWLPASPPAGRRRETARRRLGRERTSPRRR